MFEGGKFRPFRYGLRTLLLLITLVCVALTFLPHEARQYYGRKTRARQHILALGGSVDEFDYAQHPSPGTNWLSRKLGYSEAQEKLWEVTLASRPVTAADLKWIRGCGWIRVLNLSDTRVDDNALGYVAECEGLIELRLANTRVSDAGVQKLRSLARLVVLDVENTVVQYASLARLEQIIPGTNFQEQLALVRITIPELTVHSGTPIGSRTRVTFEPTVTPPAAGTLHFTRPVALTDSQVEDVRRLSSVRSLIATGVAFPADGLKFISDLRHLEHLSIDEGRTGNLRDYDLQWLTKLPKLKSLHISTSNLTDSAIRHIASMPQLEDLNICGTKFTDNGVAHLASPSSLQSLTINGTQFTPSLLVHLRRLPQLRSLHLYLWRRDSNGAPFGAPPNDVITQASAAMTVLADFPSLTELGTRGNLMVPEVLSPVTKLVNLQRLQVDGRYVSHEFARKIQEAMPHCHVQRMSRK